VCVQPGHQLRVPLDMMHRGERARRNGGGRALENSWGRER
jgi:hypothetical protein